MYTTQYTKTHENNNDIEPQFLLLLCVRPSLSISLSLIWTHQISFWAPYIEQCFLCHSWCKAFSCFASMFFFMLFIHLSKSTNQNSACQRFPGCCLSPSCKTRKYPCHDDCYNCFQSCHRYGKELTGSERKTVWIMWGRGKHSQSICSRFVTTVHTTTSTTTGVSCHRVKCANKTEVFVI